VLLCVLKSNLKSRFSSLPFPGGQFSAEATHFLLLVSAHSGQSITTRDNSQNETRVLYSYTLHM